MNPLSRVGNQFSLLRWTWKLVYVRGCLLHDGILAAGCLLVALVRY